MMKIKSLDKRDRAWMYSEIPEKIGHFLEIHPLNHLQTIIQASTRNANKIGAYIEVTAKIDEDACIEIVTVAGIKLSIDKRGEVTVLKGDVKND